MTGSRGIAGALANAEANKGGGTLDELILEDGARSLIRILGDGSDTDVLFGVYAFHTSGNGESFRDEGVCLKEFGEECPSCNANHQRRMQVVTWVWVYAVYHQQQKYPQWEAVEVRGRGRAYKEEVNAPKILKRGVGRGRAFLELFVQYYTEYGRLNDRDYLISRTGQGFDTAYSLIPRGDKKEMTLEQKRALDTLPDILDYYAKKAKSIQPVSTDENPIPLEEETSEATPF